MRALVADARPDVVYHLAARAHVGESWEDPLGTLADNVAMTANVLEAVRHEAPEATVISVGSGEEYGLPETVPTTEDAPLRPQNPYAVSKASSGLAARFYADAYGLCVIHARAFNHAGPGQEPIYAIPSSPARSRPGSRPATTPSASSPAALTPAATSPTSATSSAPTACSPNTATPAPTTSAPASPARPAN